MIVRGRVDPAELGGTDRDVGAGWTRSLGTLRPVGPGPHGSWRFALRVRNA